jgi:UDP-N-acetyl-D-glucosamine dehydrogenase
MVATEIKRGIYQQYDCVVIVTDHKTFDYDAMVAEADLIVDTRNAIKKPHPHVFRLGAARPAAAAERVGVA